MCEECTELQRDVESKQRAHERAVALTEGFRPTSRVSPEEQQHIEAQGAAVEVASVELQEARKKLTEHKRKHGG